MSCYKIAPKIKRLNIFSDLCYPSLLPFPESSPSPGSLWSAFCQYRLVCIFLDIFVNAVLQYVLFFFCLFFTHHNYFEIHLRYFMHQLFIPFHWKVIFHCMYVLLLPCCSVAKLCSTLRNPMDYSTPSFPVLDNLPEFAQTHVHWVGDSIQPSHPLSPPYPPALNLSQHQGLFQ